MSEHPFHQFINLIDFDLKIFNKQKTLELLAHEVENFDTQVQESVDQLQYAKQEAVGARKHVDVLELEIKELDHKQKEKKAQLEDLSKYKEYKSLQKEVERLQVLENEAESKLLQAWSALELAQVKLVDQQKKHDEQIVNLDTTLQEKKLAIVAIKEELDDYIALRESKTKSVPEEWIEKYNVMRTRVLDPVVAVEGGDCSACFHNLTNQEIIRLKHGALLQCKGCYRLLYSQEAVAHPEQESAHNK